MSENFYRAFEDKHRGSRELIKNRLRAYLPFLKALANIYPDSDSIDLGCGRGEWLEILKELHFHEKGVDLDSGMLSGCLENGLNVEQNDALNALKTLQTESQSIVSAFHLVEHISFEHLQILVAEALRVLKPGGILIMETPNPENIVVATSNFYLDPTHRRPIPPMLLSFMVEYAGFVRVKTVRLQEPLDLVTKVNVNISDVIGGVSPDYAVIAQKGASREIIAITNSVFTPEMGVSLDNLLCRWEKNFEQLKSQSAQAQIQSQQALNQLQEIFNSRSWRMTEPFRNAYKIAKKVKVLLKRYIKSKILRFAEWVNRHLILKKLCFCILRLFPGFSENLKKIIVNQSPIWDLDAISASKPTARAKLIYSQLVDLSEKKDG